MKGYIQNQTIILQDSLPDTLQNNYIIVTSNVREFQRVPNLQIENWRRCE